MNDTKIVKNKQFFCKIYRQVAVSASFICCFYFSPVFEEFFVRMKNFAALLRDEVDVKNIVFVKNISLF